MPNLCFGGNPFLVCRYSSIVQIVEVDELPLVLSIDGSAEKLQTPHFHFVTLLPEATLTIIERQGTSGIEPYKGTLN